MNVVKVLDFAGFFDGHGHTSVFRSVVGSHNYNLNTSESDIDFKAYVVPNIEELFNAQYYQKSLVTQVFDIELHDIRKLVNHLWKSNINFVETLFSTEILINAYFADEVKELLDIRDDIARMNLSYFYDANIGMYIEKLKKWEIKVNKGIMDFKELVTAYRVLDFLIRFHNNNFTDMFSAMKYDGIEKERLIRMKTGGYTETSFKNIINEKRESVVRLEEIYKSFGANEHTKQKLETIIFRIVKKNIKNELEML